MQQQYTREKLSKEEQQVLEDLGGFSMTYGLSKSVFKENKRVITHMPFAFDPYLISANTFYRLKNLHYLWQKLYVKVSADRQYLSTLAPKFCKDDPYMERLMQIYLKYHQSGIGVACTRVDYMGDQNPLLVQYNVMAVGLNGMSDRVQRLQKDLNRFNSPLGKYTYPENRNQQTICKALITALNRANLKTGLVLMLCHEEYFNYGEQHDFRMQMLKQGRVSLAITMAQLIQKMKFDEETKIASIDGRPIDAFYLRTGYALRYFPTEKHWEIREQMERSRSIKLPSIQMILINAKRVQSQFAKPEIVSRYLNQEETKMILGVAGQIHDFDDKTDLQVQGLIKKVKQYPYVLKPNVEGGGNNYFGEKAYQKLKQLYEEKIHLKNYILQKKITSTVSSNYFVNDHKTVFVEKVAAQFSTFGCFVYDKNQIILNECGGNLVRSKREELDEGGVCSDNGVVCGVCIVNFE